MLLLLALCCGPAIAETPTPPRVVELHYIEVNRWMQSDENAFEQLVFWRLYRDRHTGEFHTVDCGWCYWKQAALIEHDGKFVAWVPERNTLYVADDVYWTQTTFDPEMMFKTETRW